MTSAEARRNLIKHPDAFEASPAHQQHFQHKFSQARLTDLQQQSSSHKSSLPQQQEFAGRQNIELERLEKSLAEFEESQVQVNNNIEDIKVGACSFRSYSSSNTPNKTMVITVMLLATLMPSLASHYLRINLIDVQKS